MSVPNVGGLGGSGLRLGIIALAGGGVDPDPANVLNAEINFVSTVATAGDSVTLPPVRDLGTIITVKNIGGANALGVQPNVGDNVDGGVVNAPLSLLDGETVVLVATVLSVDPKTNKPQEGQYSVVLKA